MRTTTMLTVADVAALATRAGFRDDPGQHDGAALTWAVAIALAESNGDPRATRKNGGKAGTDYGLWQVNEVHGYDAAALLDDPAYNARAAWLISKHGTDFGPWRTFTSGSAGRRLREAVAATTGATHFPVTRAHTFADTWGAPRSGGRVHRGVDIFAAKGTPVVAVSDGTITALGESGLGGKRVWVDGTWYYAHLDSFAEGLEDGQQVAAGAVLGYVGTSGNAEGTSPHLHLGWDPDGTAGATWANPYFHLSVLDGRRRDRRASSPSRQPSGTTSGSTATSSTAMATTGGFGALAIPGGSLSHHVSLPPVFVRFSPLNVLNDLAESFSLSVPLVVPPGTAVRVGLQSSKVPPGLLSGAAAAFQLIPGIDVSIEPTYTIQAVTRGNTAAQLGPGLQIDGDDLDELSTSVSKLSLELVANPFEVTEIRVSATVRITASITAPFPSDTDVAIEVPLPVVALRVEPLDLMAMLGELFSATVEMAEDSVVQAVYSLPSDALAVTPSPDMARPDIELPLSIGDFVGNRIRLRQVLSATPLTGTLKAVDLPNEGDALRLLVVPTFRIMRPKPRPTLDRMSVEAQLDLVGVVNATGVAPLSPDPAPVVLVKVEVPRPVLVLPASITVARYDGSTRIHRRLICWDYKPLFPDWNSLAAVYSTALGQLRNAMKLAAMAIDPTDSALEPLHRLEFALDLVTNPNVLGQARDDGQMEYLQTGDRYGDYAVVDFSAPAGQPKPTVVVGFVDVETFTWEYNPPFADYRISLAPDKALPVWVVVTNPGESKGMYVIGSSPTVGHPQYDGFHSSALRMNLEYGAGGGIYKWNLNHSPFDKTMNGHGY